MEKNRLFSNEDPCTTVSSRSSRMSQQLIPEHFVLNSTASVQHTVHQQRALRRQRTSRGLIYIGGTPVCYVFQFSTCSTPGISSQPHLEAELCIYIILVGWRRLATALKSTTTRVSFSFPRPIWLAVELDHLCGMENLTSTHGECFVSRIIVCIW